MNTAEVYPGKDGWRYRIKAGNGEILASGEAYVRKIDCESALRALFNGGTTEVVVRNHAREVTDNYTLGRAPTLDQIYPGPFEDEPLPYKEPSPNAIIFEDDEP